MIKRRYSLLLILLVLLPAILVSAVPPGLYGSSAQDAVSAETLLTQAGYIPLREALLLAGYTAQESEGTYCKDQKPPITLHFDREYGYVYKNDYRFDLAGSLVWLGQATWIQKSKLSAIVNYDYFWEDGVWKAKRIMYAQHAWTTSFPPLVAHAGGGLRAVAGGEPAGAKFADGQTAANQPGGMQSAGNLTASDLTYTNSIDALIQNYNLGHRVFEFDLSLTRDGGLAAVHDWNYSGAYNGLPVSEAQWRAFVPKGAAYTPAMLGDILDEMMVNRDIFLITDTKSYELSEEETMRQFQRLYDEAVARDPELLSRIIPQIYDEAMYDRIARIYEYDSVIYTLYASYSPADVIYAFVASHDRVKVVTMPTYWRFQSDMPARLANMGKLVYVHTVNSIEELRELSTMGAVGFYTDFLTPADWEQMHDTLPFTEGE